MCHTENRMPCKQPPSPSLNLCHSLPILRSGQQWATLNLKTFLNRSQSKPECPECPTPTSRMQAPTSESPHLLGPARDTIRRKMELGNVLEQVWKEALYSRWLYALKAQLPSGEGPFC